MRGRLLVFVLCLLAALPLSAAITGTLMNADGQPVAGARVSVYTLESGEARFTRLASDKPERVAAATTQSDDKGKFSLESPKDPVSEIQVFAAGFSPQFLRVERDEDIGSIALTKAETKQGRITANGKGVPNARVMWIGRVETIATTDTEGRYSVPDPSKWASRVVVLHPDYAIDEARVMFGRKAEVNRTLQPGSALSGRVVAEDGKTPVKGATIRIGGFPVATSGDDGTFAITHAPTRWDWLEARLGSLIGTRAKAGDPNITIRLAKTATVSGTVRDAKTQAAIAGADVSLRRNQSADTFTLSATTDAKGNFTITGVAPNSYELNGLRPGYNVTPVQVQVSAGDRVAKTMLATQLARVSGIVTNEDKQPVAGARIKQEVVARDGAFGFPRTVVAQQAIMSGPDGTFVFRVDPDSDIEVQAEKKGYPVAKTSTLRLAPGERKGGLALTIPSGVEVTGKVTDRDERPLEGVIIGASEARGGDASTIRRQIFLGAREAGDDNMVRTQTDGTFTIRLKPGTYDVSFKREGFAAKTVRAVQVAGGAEPIAVVLDPGVEIAGRVVRNGVGIDGVNVFGFGGPDNVTAETGPDGTFRLTDLTPGDLQLNFNKPEEFIQIMRGATAPATDMVVEVPAGGRIIGRVVDKTTQQPIPSFEAGVSPQRGGGMVVMMGPPLTRPFTSESGTFVLENVPPGTTTVAVRAPGYTLARVPNITVEEGKATQEIEVALDHGVKVKGKVTGPDGAAVSGATVRLDMMGGGRIMRPSFNNEQAMTDGSGEFTFEGMEPGEHTFIASKSGLVGAQKTVNISGAETKVELQLTAGMRVTGTVVSDSGAPVADAGVSASSAAAGSMSNRNARTDANGSFQLEGVAPGRYNFTAYKEGLATGQLRDFDVSSGAPIKIVMQTGGTITGRILGLAPEELPQTSVFAQSSNGSAGGSVDASGNYRIEGAPVGTVRVMARTGGGMMGAGRMSAPKSVEVTAGGSVQQDIEFRNDTRITGRITRDGKPVPDARIMFYPRNAEAQTSGSSQADRDGYYEVTGLDDANYNVNVVDLQRGGSHSTTFQVRGSGTFNIDMQTVGLRGRVVDATNGAPIGDATVTLRRQDVGTGMFPMATAMTDASGAFVFDTVTPGAYHVNAEKDKFGSKVTDVTISNSPENLEIKLSPNPGITLRVVDARDGRMLRANVRLTDAQNRVVFESARFGMGGGAAEPIKITAEPGTYRATITASGYAAQSITITSPSSPTVGMTPGGAILLQSKGSTIRRARLMSPDGRVYERSFNPTGIFTVDPNPGTTVIENIAPGTYTVQILGPGDAVETSTQVTVGEGQRVPVEI